MDLMSARSKKIIEDMESDIMQILQANLDAIMSDPIVQKRLFKNIDNPDEAPKILYSLFLYLLTSTAASVIRNVEFMAEKKPSLYGNQPPEVVGYLLSEHFIKEFEEMLQDARTLSSKEADTLLGIEDDPGDDDGHSGLLH